MEVRTLFERLRTPWTEGKMHPRQSAESDLDEKGLALLLGELDHRIRNLLMMIEAAVRQTHSTSVDDYRAKLIARNTGLHDFYQFTTSYGRTLGLAELLEQTMRPYSANGAQVLAAGPDVELEPSLALALHLVLHELAANAKKYGALSSPLGHVKIGWTIRHLPGAPLASSPSPGASTAGLRCSVRSITVFVHAYQERT
jgi:two-component sensor histidine kinase